MALTQQQIDEIKLILIEWYGVTIFPDMKGPVSMNYIYKSRICYAAKMMSIEGLTTSRQVVDELAKNYGLTRIEWYDWERTFPYNKFFAFYEIRENNLRFALEDYK